MWTYQNTIVETLPEDCVGFVYCITNTETGRKYIGKKLSKFQKTKYKMVTLKSGIKKRKKIKSKVDSDWMEYYGSSLELSADSSLDATAQTALKIDEIICCFHDDIDNCDCRKPKTGMIIKALKKWDIDLSLSYLIGDRWRDIETAKNIGVSSILINYDYDEKKVTADFECNNLEEAANFILKIY